MQPNNPSFQVSDQMKYADLGMVTLEKPNMITLEKPNIRNWLQLAY
jgi:hypothetical protein